MGLPKARGTQQRLTPPSIYSQIPRVLRTRGPGGGASLCPQRHHFPDRSPTAYRRHGSEQAAGLAHYIRDFNPATWARKAGTAEAACTQIQTNTHAHTHVHADCLASLKATAADTHSVAQGSQRPCCPNVFVSLFPRANA